MNRGSNILRLLFGVAFTVLLAMIYWSLTLQESDIKAMRLELRELKKEFEEGGISRAEKEQTLSSVSSTVDTTYPNLLEVDPFTEKLSKLLGASFSPRGMRKEALLGRPENLHPFNNFKDVSTMFSLCVPSVAQNKFGIYEKLSPQLAYKMEARPLEDDPSRIEYWVHLRDDIYWHPLSQAQFPQELELSSHFLKKHPVTAYDFKFFYDAVMNPYMSEAKAASLRNYYGDIESFRVIDDRTFVVRWKSISAKDSKGLPLKKTKYTALHLTGSLQPLPVFVYQYFADGQKIIDEEGDSEAYRKNSVFAQNFTHHFAKNVIVSCGPWVFSKMSDEGIVLKRNPHYYDPQAALVEGIHYTFKESFDAIWQEFKAGHLDIALLSPSQLPELESFLTSSHYATQKKEGLEIQEIDFVDKSFTYIGWNEATPYFGSKKVRQAMTMAIDRNRIIEQNISQMGVPITGPFFRFSPAYDESIQPWPYDPYEAKRLLQEEGWMDLNGDGILDKVIDGKRVPFRFSMIYFSKNASTKVICEYVATTLREIGVDCQLKGMDITDLSHAFDDKAFDALVLGWTMGSPSEDPRQIWHSSGAKEKGSSNAVGFANAEIDAIIERLNYEDDKHERNALYHRFHRIVHEEQPYTFLYSPKRRLLYRNYVKNLFIPRDRQDLLPGADISEPDYRILWLSQES